jgi:hypothetical protein
VVTPSDLRVWHFDLPPRPADAVGRALSWSGRGLLAAAAADNPCPADPRRGCRPGRLEDRRWRCLDCGAWWSVAQVAGFAAAARHRQPVGVDVEDGRHRPGAYRLASNWIRGRMRTAEQWTQAEALWKAAGWGDRRPAPGEIPLGDDWRSGWQTSLDGRWWVFTAATPNPWCLAASRTGPRPPVLNVARLAWPVRSAEGSSWRRLQSGPDGPLDQSDPVGAGIAEGKHKWASSTTTVSWSLA